MFAARRLRLVDEVSFVAWIATALCAGGRALVLQRRNSGRWALGDAHYAANKQNPAQPLFIEDGVIENRAKADPEYGWNTLDETNVGFKFDAGPSWRS